MDEDMSNEHSNNSYTTVELMIESVLQNDPSVREKESRNAEETKIMLSIPRCAVTHSRCVFGCENTRLHNIKAEFRKNILKTHRIFIPEGCRVCEYHNNNPDNWEEFGNENMHYEYAASKIENAIDLLRSEPVNMFSRIFEKMGIRKESIKKWCGLNFEQILELHSTLSPSNIKQLGLISYLIKLKLACPNYVLGNIFGVTRQGIERCMKIARKAIMQYFVPLNLGFTRLNRESLLTHTTEMARALYSPDKDNAAVMIWDSTYIFIQKSRNFQFQRKTYSVQKKGNLVKPMVVAGPDGHIFDIFGVFPAKYNDATILQKVIDQNADLNNKLKSGDVFLVDRGFRDVIPKLEEMNYKVYMPHFISANTNQLTTEQANQTRITTITRQVVERCNNRLESFALLKKTYVNKSLQDLNSHIRVVAAIINHFYPPLETDKEDWQLFVQHIRKNEHKKNVLVFLKNINVTKHFIALEQAQIVFPILSLEELRVLSLGSYQIRQAESYYAQHISEDGLFSISVSSSLIQHKKLSKIITEYGIQQPQLLFGQIKSRFQEKTKHCTFFLTDGALADSSSIKAYYCTYKNGQRTIGCCAHIMCFVWYFSYARHLREIKLPAIKHNQILTE